MVRPPLHNLSVAPARAGHVLVTLSYSPNQRWSFSVPETPLPAQAHSGCPFPEPAIGLESLDSELVPHYSCPQRSLQVSAPLLPPSSWGLLGDLSPVPETTDGWLVPGLLPCYYISKRIWSLVDPKSSNRFPSTARTPPPMPEIVSGDLAAEVARDY